MSLSRPSLAVALAMVLVPALAVVTWRTGALATAAVRDVTWTQVASQPYGTVEGSGLALNGKLYSFGGFDAVRILNHTAAPTARSYVYDPATDQWSPIAPLPSFNGASNPGVSHAGHTTDGRYIYLAGGYSGDNSSPTATGNRQIFGAKDVIRYDPVSDSYSRLPNLPAERGAGSLEYADGHLHFMGGTNRARDRECPEHWSLDLANPAAGWVSKAPMPTPRNHLASAVVAGKIYVIGGQFGQDAKSTSSAAVNRYDPATDQWTTLPSMPRGLDHTTATVLNGDIVVMGGQTFYNTPRTVTYAYDPARNTWTQFTPLPALRYSGTSGTIGDVVYYSGGSTGPTVSSTTWKGVPVPLTTPTGTPTRTPTPTVTPAPTPTPTPGPTRRFNFQPATGATPSGHTADSGAAYDAGRGSGWVRQDSLSATAHAPLDLTANTRRRNANADVRLDTFVMMQAVSASAGATTVPGAWELAVPKGTYRVTATVGDPSSIDSAHTIRAEGTTLIDRFVPTSAVKSREASGTVSVNDGRLTIDAIGGSNTKLDAVVVEPLTVSAVSTPVATTADEASGDAAPETPVVAGASPAAASDAPAAVAAAPAARSAVAAANSPQSETTPVAALRREAGRLLVTRLAVTPKVAGRCPKSATATLRTGGRTITRKLTVTASGGTCLASGAAKLPARFATAKRVSVTITHPRLRRAKLVVGA